MPLMAGAAASAAAGATAQGAFGYNRGNYMFDAGLRFARFTAGYGFMQDQTAQYREDIRDLTALSCAKMDTYHGVGVIFFVLNFQLIMAGRLGVHGPSPPGWLLAIYWTNVSCALMYLCTYTWLAMHASARAQAAGANLLTRSVRVPIPTPAQLDRARRTGNSYEKQRVTDVFRVPFVVPAPKETIPEEAAMEEGKPITSKPVPGSKRRMPKWYQDEQKELMAGEGGPVAEGGTPAHFELYRGVQQEWVTHDCYARLGLMFFLDCWFASIPLYSQCHCFGELRVLWPAWSVSFIFCIAHFCMLKCDIVGCPKGKFMNFPTENLRPFTPMLCVLGLSLDYSIAKYNSGIVAFIYFISWICYIIQFAHTIRLYDLCSPRQQSQMPEAAGQPWYPAEWSLPQVFAGVTYIVAPPSELEPGEHCLTLAMKAGKGARAEATPHKKGRDIGPSLFPWRLFRGAILTHIALWLFIMTGRVIEQVHGERYLLKQEGRVQRWPSHMQPWMTPWTRKGSRNEWSHTGGSDRRLHEVEESQVEKVSTIAQRLAATLGPLADALEAKSHIPQVRLPAPLRADMAWPAKLQPALLASKGDGLLAALARKHHGAIARISDEMAKTQTQSFTLEGISELEELLGASWGSSGLMVTTTKGSVMECSGLPAASGAWPCKQIASPLPNGGSSVKAAVVARIPGTAQLRAAVSFEGDEAVVIFDADVNANSWTPAGEVQLPKHAHAEAHFSFSPAADELIISGRNGGVMKWRISENAEEPAMVATPVVGSAWHAACQLGNGRLAHLASHGSSVPELYVSERF
eukprot:TRINITY_DN6962_c0_g2_i1.p1 TRINITY_DN6962_c0_g2~~TRINITY_DN6962_c0_g2_i1.p1  ORF type:complete len:803 (+),score=197.65 TRINITY_DN6962_c0_g2_i1:245-2653(+)